MESPSALLMRCLEDFGESEATLCCVIFRQEDGSVNWRANQDCNASEVIGLLTCVRATLMHDWIEGMSSGDKTK
jgi:hypothetical protein